jgi:hypothetical protein
VTRDPQIERVHEDLGMTRPAEANRALTMGAAIAVVLAVFGVIALVFWLFL